MEKELYIFSNVPTPPVREFREGLSSDYINLCEYFNPEKAAAPNYLGTPEHGVEEIDRFKRDLVNKYDFILVYKHYRTELVKGYKGADEEVRYYKYSHKEFNLPNERKRA